MAGEIEYYGGAWGDSLGGITRNGVPERCTRTADLLEVSGRNAFHVDAKLVLRKFKKREAAGKIPVLKPGQIRILCNQSRGTIEEWAEIKAVVEARIAAMHEIRIEILGAIQSGDLK